MRSNRESTAADKFLRFVIARRDADSTKPQGIFVPAYELLRGGELEIDLYDRLKLAVEWFQFHLPLPDRSKLHPRGIFWFKANAEKLVRRMWEIVRVVEYSGFATKLLLTSKPGYVIYEDDFQVCAVPFKDTVKS